MSEPTIPDRDEALEQRQTQRVQRYIADLRQAAESWRGRAIAARLATNPHDTDTVIDQYGDPPIGLPAGCDVTFRLLDPDPTHQQHYITVRVRPRTPGLPARIEILGSDRLLVHPQSGTTIHASVARL